MPRSRKTAREYFVCIMHEHGDELGATVGRIAIGPTDRDDELATERIKFWLAKKRQQHGCERYSDPCGVQIRENTPGLKSLQLRSMSESISPEVS